MENTSSKANLSNSAYVQRNPSLVRVTHGLDARGGSGTQGV